VSDSLVRQIEDTRDGKKTHRVVQHRSEKDFERTSRRVTATEPFLSKEQTRRPDQANAP
jgi:hypothetical protein